MTDDSVCIVGTGACTAVGLSSAAAAAAVRAGIANFVEHISLTNMLDEPLICAAPHDHNLHGEIVDRLVALLCAAFTDALEGLPNFAREGFQSSSLLLALPEERPGLPSGLRALVSERLLSEWPQGPRPFVGETGHAGGGIALASAQDIFKRSGSARLAVAGVDSYLSKETVLWLDQKRMLHTTYNAWGFVPGQASGVVLLSTLSDARAMGVRPLVVLERVGIDHEEVPIMEEGVCLGWGLTRCVRSVCETLCNNEKVDRIYCDQNGQTYKADEMGFMLARLANRFHEPAAFVAPADCWGDVGAATVPLLAGLVANAALRGYSTGPLSLLLAGSNSGRRCAVLLRTVVNG